MGASKTDLFTNDQNELATINRALAHPARIAILQYLIKVNSCVCNSIVDHIPLSQPTISQHLRELKSVGLIKGTIEGNSVCYCINQEKWKAHKSLLDALFNSYNSNKTCC